MHHDGAFEVDDAPAEIGRRVEADRRRVVQHDGAAVVHDATAEPPVVFPVTVDEPFNTTVPPSFTMPPP